ncbi:MAG: cellulase family glycosylhydrolase [Balneolales bacterium]
MCEYNILSKNYAGLDKKLQGFDDSIVLNRKNRNKDANPRDVNNKIKKLQGAGLPIALVMFATVLVYACSDNNEIMNSRPEIEAYRGFNISPSTDNSQLDTVKAITGANLFRLGGPYVSKEPPYEFIESAFQHLGRVLDWAESNDIRVVIDPHTTPGTRSRWTIYPEDEFWQDKAWHEHLIKVWVRIARENKHRGDVIFGYDLLNEPAIPDPSIHGDQWNELVAVLVDTIRAVGDQHPIIVEPAFVRLPGGGFRDRIEGLEDLILPNDDNLIVSPHVYEPFLFTHQGVNDNPAGVPYPGQIGETFWDKNELSAHLQPIRDFKDANKNVPIFIGEFSASRAGGEDSNAYLEDLIDLFEAEGWSWAYHDLRGGRMWDPERPVGTNAAEPRNPDTPRMKLLRNYYSRK